MSPNFDEILLELGYRFGIVDLSKEQQINELIEILKESGVDSPNELAQKARVYFSYLNEDDIVKNKKTGNVYIVKKMDPTKHVKPNKKEIDKAKAAAGGKLPKAEPKEPNVKGKSVFGTKKGGKVFEPKKEKAEYKPTETQLKSFTGKKKVLTRDLICYLICIMI